MIRRLGAITLTLLMLAAAVLVMVLGILAEENSGS